MNLIEKIPTIIIITILASNLLIVSNIRSSWYIKDNQKIPLERRTVLPLQSIIVGVE